MAALEVAQESTTQAHSELRAVAGCAGADVRARMEGMGRKLAALQVSLSSRHWITPQQ